MFTDIIWWSLQHWTVFTEVSEVFILVPALLGLKGNLEMTLASRLSTAVRNLCVCVRMWVWVLGRYYLYHSHLMVLKYHRLYAFPLFYITIILSIKQPLLGMCLIAWQHISNPLKQIVLAVRGQIAKCGLSIRQTDSNIPVPLTLPGLFTWAQVGLLLIAECKGYVQNSLFLKLFFNIQLSNYMLHTVNRTCDDSN